MRRFRDPRRFAVPLLVLAITATAQAQSSGNRLLGLDVSAWQGNISQTTWNNLRSVENRQFAFMRASRGGTTGVDKRNGGYPANDDTDATLSRRYDDPYFVQNMNRATAAGMFVGSYHFARPEIIASTTNSGGIANSAVDEADHYIQMAGAFMRPGYLPPTFDLETGDGIRTDNELAQYSIDFSNRVYEVMRIRPMMYINGNYAQNVLAGATAARRDQLAKPAAAPPSLAGPAYSQLWIARYPNQANPNAINVQTGNPSDGLSTVYGPWDDYGTAQPWTFWQYASTGRLASFNSGNSDLDFNVLNGGVEYLRDQLVPAVWWTDTGGDWSTLANWNSGQTPATPVSAPGQLTPIGTQTLPTPRLPGTSGTAPTSGRFDTVILDRPTADISVTLSSGTFSIRKFYVRESFAMTGGSLTVNYVPVAESTPLSVQVSASTSISGSASFSAHTIQVDAARRLTAGNATLTFDTLTLGRGTTPATLSVNGDVTIMGTSGSTAKIGTSSGTAASGVVDLGGGTRTITVANGAAAVDLQVAVPIVNGGLTKSGSGTMLLTAVNTYSGATTVRAGTLVLGTAATIASSTSIRVDAGATFDVSQKAGGYVIAPGQTISGSGTLVGSVTLSGGVLGMSSLAIGSASGLSRLTKTSGTIAGAPAVTVGSGGAWVLPATSPAGVDVGSLAVNSAVGGGELDVGTSLVNVAAGGMSAAQLVAALTAGRNGGSWAGAPGITSRSVAADVAAGLSRSVGWMSRGDGGLTFGYAAPGDTNLDGLIDVVDMATFMSAGKYESGLPATWAEGDFNYDGFVDLLDAADFMAGGLFDAGIYNAPAASIAAVPEPAVPAVIGLLVAVLSLARAAPRRRGPRAAGSLGAAAGSTRARLA
jgi:autotransporter-associated beta strand protein